MMFLKSCNISETKADSDTKVIIPLRATNPHIVSKNQVSGHIRSAVSDVRVTSLSDNFYKKRFTGISATGRVKSYD